MPQSDQPSQPAPAAPQAAPAMTSTVPPAQPAAAPATSGKPSCGYVLLIIIVTVICTLIAEVVFAFAVAAWVAKKISSAVSTNSFSITTSDPNAPKGYNALSPDQKNMLKQMGITPDQVPADLDVQKITCIQNALGSNHIADIISGKATPGFSDLMAAKSCF